MRLSDLRDLRDLRGFRIRDRYSSSIPEAMTQDYYEILQVHPRADNAAITAAYQRLRENIVADA